MDVIKKFEPLFGEWYAESLIGAGSYGRVYKAYREEFGERYYSAIKYISIPADEYEVTTLRDDGMDDDSITTYYTALAKDVSAETRLMSRLKGFSNIVSYEDSRVIPKANGFGYDIFIRMELLESLSERTRKSSLSQDEVLSLGMDLCTALDICGEQGVIHRDIKPDNIFINSHGDFKLGDFGIARQLEKTATFMSKKGTYNYMAPEVYKGEKYGASCDIYSLGLVMYRLLNKNRLPFFPPAPQQINPMDKEAALLAGLQGKPMSYPCDSDERLSEAILKACAFEPDDRFQTAKEFYAALSEIKQSSFAIITDNDKIADSGDPVSRHQKISDFEPDTEKTVSIFQIPPMPNSDTGLDSVQEEESQQQQHLSPGKNYDEFPYYEGADLLTEESDQHQQHIPGNGLDEFPYNAEERFADAQPETENETDTSALVKQAEDFAEAGHYRSAWQLFDKAAEMGDGYALYRIGEFYQQGSYVKESPEKAFDCFKKASEEYGSAHAANALAICYLNGYGCKEDHSKAFSLFEEAASQGLAKAQYNLGMFYLLKENYTMAWEWFDTAYMNGMREAKPKIKECLSKMTAWERIKREKLYW